MMPISSLPVVQRHPAIKKFFPVGLVLLLTLLLYIPSLRNGFVWDDYITLVANDFVKSLAHVPRIFSRDYLTKANDIVFVGAKDIGTAESTYRPVVTLSYFFDYAFWKLDPLGYHAHNLVLHFFNTFLVYALILNLTRRRPAAFMGSLLFGWHPVHALTVGGIWAREDLQAFFFYALSFFCYIRAGDPPFEKKGGWTAVALSAFFLALFAKEMAMTLPLIVLLYDDLYRGKMAPGARHVGFLAVLAFYGVIRFFVLALPDGMQGRFLADGGVAHAASMLGVIAAYVRWLIAPLDLHYIMPEDISHVSLGLADIRVLTSFFVLAGLLALAFGLRRSCRDISFGLFWFFVALIPVMNIVPLKNFMALRYLYIPSFGFCLVAAGTLARAWPPAGVFRKRMFFLGFLTLLVLGVYARGTLKLIPVMKDNFSFTKDLVRHYPRVLRVRSLMGMQYYLKGDLQAAGQEFTAALRLEPRYGNAYLGQGMIYYQRGKTERAVRDFQEALRMDPHLWRAHEFLGNIFFEQKRYRRAIDQYRQLLEKVPRYVPAYNKMGLGYDKLGQPGKARRMWRLALTIDPDNSFAIHHLSRHARHERF